MPLSDYYTCNCCLYAQELTDPFYDGAHLSIPEKDKEDFIDCHFYLNQILPATAAEFQVKYRNFVGCGCWTCGICGSYSKSGHEKCWSGS